jgi:hypothetical protein
MRPLRSASSWVTTPTCRLADGQLEPLAAQLLDEDAELQLAAPLHLPRVGPVGVAHAQRDVADELGIQAVLEQARRELRAVAARERRGVDADDDAQRRLVDGDDRQRPRVGGVGECLADRHVGDAGDLDELARPGLVGGDTLERLGDVELGELGLLDAAVGAAPGDGLALAQRPVVDPADRQAPDVRRRVEVRHARLQRMAVLERRRGDRLHEQVEQRHEVAGEVGRRLGRRATGLGVAVDDREVDLVLVGIEVEEQLLDLVDDLVDARVGAVDLVDDEHDREARLERLAQHEPRLRQRALGRVDEQQDAVDHRHPALDLAAEVGMARRVDDVDLRPRVPDRRVLGEDRDPALALEIHRVHDPVVDLGALAERPGLAQHRVDQRRLAVVDVGDDRDVAEVLAALGHPPRIGGRQSPATSNRRATVKRVSEPGTRSRSSPARVRTFA